MTQPASDEPVLFAEDGSTWWPALWGPLFAVIGAVVELVTGGPVHWSQWLVVAVALGGGALVWVQARRKVYLVRLTTATLTQGREVIPVDTIAQVSEVGVPVGAKVLGGGWTVPRKTNAVPLRLSGGSVVLAWARDDDTLREALRRLVEPDPN
ncbi:hypothetical protein BLA60_28180 [Actinophytocola xinjiangensis]|uniref:DUF3093 family protein n=1 Tax=Actinophytocola xinjiangensis TaxID=485602 RepID=A0A7Z0WH71_9PSEU|nr:hypothetical protein [Actinophytocola xinjiangensis]OLF07101.1 hypothetical protein BLA60_28180 [Actinophytocola xinjiangensis]